MARSKGDAQGAQEAEPGVGALSATKPVVLGSYFSMSKLPAQALAIALVAGATLACAPLVHAGESWIKDSKGCKISNPTPKAKETVTWSGRCVQGVAQGKGVLQFTLDGKPGARYEGELQKGVMAGRGTLRTPDGAVYDGDWVEGKPDGYGQYTAPDGSTFAGGWTAGKQDGPGTLRKKDGSVAKGRWKDGQYVGP